MTTSTTTTSTTPWLLQLDRILKGLEKRQKLAVLAALNLAMVNSIDSKGTQLDDITAGFYNAANCLYVKRSLRSKDADELMSRGVQLADLFDLLPRRQAEAELKRERSVMLTLCQKLLAIGGRQVA